MASPWRDYGRAAAAFSGSARRPDFSMTDSSAGRSSRRRSSLPGPLRDSLDDRAALQLHGDGLGTADWDGSGRLHLR